MTNGGQFCAARQIPVDAGASRGYFVEMKRAFTLLVPIILFIILAGPRAFRGDDEPAPPPAAAQRPASQTFYLFYSLTCARCREARVFIGALKTRYPGVDFVELEIVKSRKNQEILGRFAEELGIQTPGVPIFIFDGSYLVGFKEGNRQRRQVVAMIERGGKGRHSAAGGQGVSSGQDRAIDLPLFGEVDPRSLSLPLFTVFIGLVDGLNPCALWVLMLLLSVIGGASTRRRMIVVGAIFIFFSGLLYFLFMTAWFNFFAFLRFKRAATLALGIGVCALGLVNIKELFFFKKGPSLMIPERAKPRIYGRMRGIVSSPNTLLLVLGTASLAFIVNLAEFGCTVGLPAIYTRVLSLQRLGTLGTYALMALYNAVYVVPLVAVFLAFVFTLGRYRLGEKQGRWLKIASGTVMLALGLALVLRPELLMFI